MDSIFKSLVKTTAKIADITRALGLKGFMVPLCLRSAIFILVFYISFVSFTNRILGISSVLCHSASPLIIPEAVPLSMFVCNL